MNDKIAKLEAKAQKLRDLMAEFPDLQEETDRWKNKKFFSKKVNDIATHISTYHSCGCCTDIPLLAAPYIKFNGETIYAAKEDRILVVVIGNRNYDYADEWYYDWKERLDNEGVPLSAIESIEKYANVVEDE